MQQINTATAQGVSVAVHYNQVPDVCPICHHAVFPRLVGHAYSGEARGGVAHLYYQCTRVQCGAGFIGIYSADKHSSTHDYHRLFRVWPKTAAKHAFSDVIAELSPSFVEIYQQALAAEAYDLDQVSGLALRKALEFLVKDYAIHENPEEGDNIRKLFLGAVIKDFVKDPSVQACAARAAWLGNDEAHYIRRWDDKDVRDLKLLVRLTVNWIENVLLTEQYAQEMPTT